MAPRSAEEWQCCHATSGQGWHRSIFRVRAVIVGLCFCSCMNDGFAFPKGSCSRQRICHESSSLRGSSSSTPQNVRLVVGGLGGRGWSKLDRFFRFPPAVGRPQACTGLAPFFGFVAVTCWAGLWGGITSAADAADARLLRCERYTNLIKHGTNQSRAWAHGIRSW